MSVGLRVFVIGDQRLAGVERFLNQHEFFALHGMILRPPAFRATRTSLDTSAAAALPGVSVIEEGDLVGVVAPSRYLAQQALGASASRAAHARSSFPLTSPYIAVVRNDA